MCGIAGVLALRPDIDPREVISRMEPRIRHRGPDGSGSHCDGAAAIAHSRLAVIDVVHGAQPLTNEAGTHYLVANCEIYNYRELRDQLCARGHVFATNTDAEVLLHGYEEWGDDLPRRLRGMFAFAILDMQHGDLFFARDPYGIKPLLWYLDDGCLLFASELPAILAGLPMEPVVDLRSIDLYLRYRYIPNPMTIYRGILRLPPGNFVRVSLKGRITGPQPFASLPDVLEAPVLADGEWRRRIEDAVSSSIAAHCVADVPIGLLLSGGIDSTVVAKFARAHTGIPLQAFCADFAGSDLSEVRYARHAAEILDLQLRTVRVGPEAVQLLPSLLAHAGEPLGDPSFVPTFCVMHEARSHVPVVLSGDGGDEVFGGYETYDVFVNGDRPMDILRTFRRDATEGVGRSVEYVARRLTAGRKPDRAAWERCIEFFTQRERLNLWRDDRRAIVTWDGPWRAASLSVLATDLLDFAQRMDLMTYLPANVLPKVDTASMFHGLEVRTPLLDAQVVELALSLPRSQRFRVDTPHKTVSKYALKALLRDRFDTAFVDRHKQGFLGPLGHWLRDDAANRAMCDRVFLSNDSPLCRYFRPAALRREYAFHSAGGDSAGRIWLLLALGLWLEANPRVRDE